MKNYLTNRIITASGILLLALSNSPAYSNVNYDPYSNSLYGYAKGCGFFENWFGGSNGPWGEIQGDSGTMRVGVGLWLNAGGSMNLGGYNDEFTVVKVDAGCTAYLAEHHNNQGRKLILPAGIHSLTDYGFNDMASYVGCDCETWSDTEFMVLSSYYQIPPNNTVYFSGEFTIESWVLFLIDSSDPDDYYAHWARVMDFSNGPNQDNVLLAASLGTTGRPVFAIHRNGVGHSVESPFSIPKGRWSHLAATFKNGHGKLYINGQLVAENTSMPAPAEVVREQMYIGKSAWSIDSLLRGRLRDFRIYSTSLEQDQIQKHMSGGLGLTFTKEIKHEQLRYNGYIKNNVLYDSSPTHTDAIKCPGHSECQ